MTEQWQELKETIKELRYSNGDLTQQEVCSFLGVYMETLEKQMQQPSEDAVSRGAVEEITWDWENFKTKLNQEGLNVLKEVRERIADLPPVKPKYTDEEIDKAQAVEQAYVDKMVELAVEEIKERYSDAIGKIKKAIDEMTEIHSDGEFYIKNVDAKWIISKYLCGAEMSGGADE